jgi:hypothetical protein
MAKRKTRKTYTPEEALVADIEAGRPIPQVVVNADGMFPKPCAIIAGKLVPMASASEGSKLLRVGDTLGAVRWIADSALTWASALLPADDPMRDVELWKDATDMLRVVHDLRYALDQGDIGQASLSSIRLGTLQERLRCRVGKYDRAVAREIKRRTGKRGKDAERKVAADDRMGKGLKRYDDIMAARPRTKQSTAAKEIGVSVRTLRDWLKQRQSGNG